MLSALYGMAPEDEIDLLEYWRIVWRNKWKIIGISLVAALLAVGVSLRMPNIYRAEVLMAPVSSDSGKSGGIASALGSLGGGLSSLAGLTLGSSSSSEQNLAVLRSRAFLWDFIRENHLMPVLFAKRWDAHKHAWKANAKKPSLWDAYRLFRGVLEVSTDSKTGLVRVYVSWKDPALAADWANRLVARLNEYLRHQAIARSQGDLKYLNEELERTSLTDVHQVLYSLIAQEQKKAMIANTQMQYAFRVLDAAVAPDQKYKPRRSWIVILSMLITGMFVGVFIIFREKIMQRNDEPEAV